MICAEVVNVTKTERRLKESINKVKVLLKAKKSTMRENQVTIKELEETIVDVGSKLDDGSQVNSLIATKDNETVNLKNQLKIPNVHRAQTTEINKKILNKKRNC